QGVALGYNTSAENGFVAIGRGASASQSDVSDAGGRFTGKSFKGEVVSVGNAKTDATRRIVNVEDGANDTDAVNVRQLQKVVDDWNKNGAVIEYDKIADE